MHTHTRKHAEGCIHTSHGMFPLVRECAYMQENLTWSVRVSVGRYTHKGEPVVPSLVCSHCTLYVTYPKQRRGKAHTYVYSRMYTHTHTHIRTHPHTHTHTHTYTCKYRHSQNTHALAASTHLHTQAHSNSRKHTHTHMHSRTITNAHRFEF